MEKIKSLKVRFYFRCSETFSIFRVNSKKSKLAHKNDHRPLQNATHFYKVASLDVNIGPMLW